MKDLDDQLDRLFRAAGRQPAPDLAAPYGMETRVLAAWRETAGFSVWNPALLLRGLVAAFVLMLLSFWPLVKGTASSTPASDYLQLADSTVQVSDYP